MDDLTRAAQQISLFCRLNLHTRSDLPVRSSEMGMLIYLVKTDGEKTPNAVAKFFKFTKSRATNMVTALSKKGYLKRQQSGTDGRRFLLIPTEQAIELVNNTYQDYFKTMAVLQTRMGMERFNHFISDLATANDILLEEKNNG